MVTEHEKKTSESTMEKEQENDQDTITSEEAASSSKSELLDDYICAICLLYLRDPVLTICGHHFCQKCLHQWTSEHSKSCPIEHNPLSEIDVFPDNHTKRVMAGFSKPCPHNGCFKSIPLHQFEDHVDECDHSPTKNENQEVNCRYAGIGCNSGQANPTALENHEANSFEQHFQMMLNETNGIRWMVRQCQQHSERPILSESICRQLCYLNTTAADQRNRLGILNNELRQLTELSVFGNGQKQIVNGKLLWKIQKFSEKKDRLLNNHQDLYSPTFYTSETGYRFRIRIKISTSSNALAIFVHVVKGYNDEILMWPFVGEIEISLIHPTMHSLNKKSKIETNGVDAFNKPQFFINPKSFGFTNTVTIEELYAAKYIKDDELIIYCHIKPTVEN